MKIPYSKPHFFGTEINYLKEILESHKKVSGNGPYTQWCQKFLSERYNSPHSLLTTSCTDALEMSADLLSIQPGDEIILPSYTFVSTANPFVKVGATLKFADSEANNPNISFKSIEKLITKKTKAIVPVHYAGVSCDMDKIMKLASSEGIKVIEDAAQAIESTCNGKQLGTIGDMGAYSFHETKNITGGEAGLLLVNNIEYAERAEIIWEKGTNRSAFSRGEVDKYKWVDIGSSHLPSELNAAVLKSQLEHIDIIQKKRVEIWNKYFASLKDLNKLEVGLPDVPSYATQNGHIFYLVARSQQERDGLLKHLTSAGISAVTHYHSLHSSPFFQGKYNGEALLNADKFSTTLLRLPIFYDLSSTECEFIIEKVQEYYRLS